MKKIMSKSAYVACTEAPSKVTPGPARLMTSGAATPERPESGKQSKGQNMDWIPYHPSACGKHEREYAYVTRWVPVRFAAEKCEM